MVTVSPRVEMIVDSIPTWQSPPSKIAFILPFISSSTCFAVVGLGLPEVFALGAAIGVPADLINNRAISQLGILMPTVSNPPVVFLGTISLAFKMRVIGPGQKASINFFAFSSTSSAILSISSISLMCKIKGLSPGLPFAANIFETAFSFNPSAPSP